MKKVIITCLLAVLFGGVSLFSCKKETIDPGTYVPISFSVPAGWPQPVYKFTNNALTSDGFVLGRKLFYDTRLSRDSSISCGSCHQQFASFANIDHDVSHGFNNQLGTRNSPALSIVAWMPSFFWDGGVINVENQPINPIQNPVEMDLPMTDVIARLSANATYRSEFKKAFGDEAINSQRVFRALAQFMASMVSSNSKYDQFSRGEHGVTFSASELRGLDLFRTKCATCHKEPLLSDFSFRNNGLSVDPFVNDSGRARITRDANDLYKFRVPSLRNVDLSRPYMHDGRFQTLDAVLEHYRSGIVSSATLDPLLAGGIAMSDSDKADIINFLKTLSDSIFVKDTRFADPNH
jgi:cytochrome c peroxidase